MSCPSVGQSRGSPGCTWEQWAAQPPSAPLVPISLLFPLCATDTQSGGQRWLTSAVLVFLQGFLIHLPFTCILAAQPSDTAQFASSSPASTWVSLDELLLNLRIYGHNRATSAMARMSGAHPQLGSFSCAEKWQK